MNEAPPYWYSVKRFRLGGRTALTWQAWAIDLGIVALFFVAGPWFRSSQRPVLQLSVFFGILLARAAIAHWKGEPDNWR